MPRTIRIRTKRTDPLDREMSWMTFWVEAESSAVIEINNRRTDYLATRALLSKMPDGTLQNSAGQAFEVHPEDRA